MKLTSVTKKSYFKSALYTKNYVLLNIYKSLFFGKKKLTFWI